MTDILTSLSTFGESLLSWCISTNLSTVVLLVLAIIADRLLSRRLAAAYRIALYIPVVLKVILPLDFTWAVPFWVSPTPSPNTATPILPFAASSAFILDCVPPDSFSTRGIIVTAAYAFGVVALVAWWCCDLRKVHRIIATARRDIADSDILISQIVGPMVAGAFSPRILVPTWLIGSDALPLILAHERAHIARRDPLFAAALRLMCALAWPILPLWIATSRIRALMEHACDDIALGSPTSRQQETIMKYAHALIEVADRSTHLPRTLAFGTSLQSRIVSLRAGRRWPRALQIALATFAASSLVACSVARPGSSQAQSGSPAESQSPTAESTSVPRNSASWDLRQTTPAPRASNLVDAPSAETRIINVRIISGHVPVAGLYANPSAPKLVIAPTDQLAGSLMQLTDVTTLAAPRLLVHIDQPAAIQVGNDQHQFSVQLQVHPSATGTTSATLNYLESDQYVLKNYPLLFKKSECAVVSIPASSPGKPQRTLIITIDRPGEEAIFGC